MAICCCSECNNLFITKNESENVAVCPKCGKSADILSADKIKEKKDDIYLSALHKKQIALYPRDLYEAKELFSALGTYRDTPEQIESCNYLASRMIERERAEDDTRTFSPKKIKKSAKIVLAVVLTLAVLTVSAFLLISPVKYQIAKKNYEKGAYEKSAELFSEIADYSDSIDYLKKIYARFSEKEGKVVSCSALEPWFDVNAGGAITFIRSNYSGDGNIVIPAVFDGIKVDAIGRNAFKNFADLKSVDIPDGVTSINDYAFYGCTSVKEITLPESVDTISHYAFMKCTSLENINIPEGVTAISSYAFASCPSLNFPELPDTVQKIDASAFIGCNSFTKVTLPKSVSYIGAFSFDGCENMTEITFSPSVTEIGENAFGGCTALAKVIFMGSESDYKAISIDKGNDALTNSDIEYASK